jgi:hypothetical protein
VKLKELNTKIALGNLKDTSVKPFIAIVSTDRQSIIEYMDEIINLQLGNRNELGLNLILPCGCQRTFKLHNEIPFDDLKCEHGNYFIKYLVVRGI